MKKLINLLSFMLFFCLTHNVLGQSSCKSTLYIHSGPTSTIELKLLLKTSTKPALADLDDATKASLVEKMLFDNFKINGMDTYDANIQNLYLQNKMQGVLNAIFGTPVLMYTADNRPSFITISAEDFTQLLARREIGANPPVAAPTWCSNCTESIFSFCCIVFQLHGCADELVALDNNLYKIQ